MRINGPIAYIVLYAALYAAFGVASPFWPKFFETRALTSQQIGLILAAAMLMRLVAGPMVGMLTDHLGSLRLVLATCAALDAVAVGMAAAASGAVSKIETVRAWTLGEFKGIAEKAARVATSYVPPGR